MLDLRPYFAESKSLFPESQCKKDQCPHDLVLSGFLVYHQKSGWTKHWRCLHALTSTDQLKIPIPITISLLYPWVSRQYPFFHGQCHFFPGQSILLPCLNQHQKLSDTPRAVLSGYVSHKISPLISRWPHFLVINPQAIGTKLSTKMILHCVHKYPHCCWLYHQVSWSKQTNTLLFHGSSTIKIPISGIPIIKKDCWIPFN